MFKFTYRVLLITILSCFSTLEFVVKADNDFTVVIDAGHGGKDIGATDNGVMEKNINLKVAKQLESLIKKKMKNTQVVMTRTNDSFLSLQERADIANKAKGHLFISIHTNSVDRRNKNRKNLSGSSVYTLGLHKDENNLDVARRENSVIELETDYEQKYSGFDPQRDESYIIFEMAQKNNLSQSIKFAENVEHELEKAGRDNRGVHQAGFWVLWATSMPSVLIELDFICNPTSAKYLSSDKGAKELAEAIFKAVKKYEENWNKPKKTVSNANNDISHTYIQDAEGNLEDTYTLTSDTPVATARIRTHKNEGLPKPHVPDQMNGNQKKNDARRRRSVRSRELSLNNSYEKDNLNVSVKGNYAMASPILEDQDIVGLDNAVVEKSKEKNKDSEKKKKEPKKKVEKKQRRGDAYNAKVNKLVTVYKIQVLASSDLLNQNNSRFCGLSPISTYKENNIYKYYYGESMDKSEVEALLADVRKKIPDAFIVSSQKTIQKK